MSRNSKQSNCPPQVFLNGKRVVLSGTNLQAFCAHHFADDIPCVVMLNGHVIRRHEWQITGIKSGDRVDVFSPIEGG